MEMNDTLFNKRYNSLNGRLLREVDHMVKIVYCERDEYGMEHSPITDYIASYYDGYKLSNVMRNIANTLENYDMLILDENGSVIIDGTADKRHNLMQTTIKKLMESDDD